MELQGNPLNSLSRKPLKIAVRIIARHGSVSGHCSPAPAIMRWISPAGELDPLFVTLADLLDLHASGGILTIRPRRWLSESRLFKEVKTFLAKIQELFSRILSLKASIMGGQIQTASGASSGLM